METISRRYRRVGRPTSPGAGLLAALLLLVGTIALTGCRDCRGDSSGAVPETAEDRLQKMAVRLPAEATGAVFISDIGRFRQEAGSVKKRLSDVVPLALVEIPETQLRQYLGIAPMAAKSWEQAGLGDDAGLTLASVDRHPVALAFVRDRSKFESHLVDQAKAAFGLEGGPKSETVGKQKMKVLGADADERVAWTWQDNLAVVVFPAYPGSTGAPTVTAALSDVLDTRPEVSLWKSDGFRTFREAIGEQSFYVYGTPTAALDRAGLPSSEPLPGAGGSLLGSMRERLQGVGMAVEVVERGLKARTWFGLTDDAAEEGWKSWQERPTADWGRFVTDRLLAGFRAQVSWEDVRKRLLEPAEEQNRAVQRDLKRFTDRTGVDLQRNVLEHIRGPVGVFVYGVKPNFSFGQLQARPLEALPNVEMLVAINLDDTDPAAASAKTLADKLDWLETRQIEIGKSAARVVTSPRYPITLYLYDGLLVAATPAVSDQTVAGYLGGEPAGEAALLAGSERMTLGARFAEGPRMTGLYLNFVRAFAHLENRLPPFPPLVKFLTGVHEVLVVRHQTETGYFLDTILHLSDLADDE